MQTIKVDETSAASDVEDIAHNIAALADADLRLVAIATRPISRREPAPT